MMTIENEAKIKYEHAESVRRAKVMIKNGADIDSIIAVTSMHPEEVEKLMNAKPDIVGEDREWYDARF